MTALLDRLCPHAWREIATRDYGRYWADGGIPKRHPDTGWVYEIPGVDGVLLTELRDKGQIVTVQKKTEWGTWVLMGKLVKGKR
jgi:hypothetical protein